MKGAIGNAFIMNMVITFIVIFYMLLIGSMAYSKAYRTKNYMVDLLDRVEQQVNPEHEVNRSTRNLISKEFDNQVNEFLGRVGYNLSYEANTCPNLVDDGYLNIRNTSVGSYDYCLYMTDAGKSQSNTYSNGSYNYMVMIYMQFDFPVIGKFIKVPFRGETRTYWRLK